MRERPSRLMEEMVSSPSIPATASSIRWVIFVSTTFDDAPSYVVSIEIVGTSISGYSRTAMRFRQMKPNTTSRSMNTIVATGRTMENWQIVISSLLPFLTD